ncbi:hypothetical protein AB0387_27390 [Streptomyces sp. NPDC089173]|uniref:hypothetical protein n=1 Tax=Streptomyces sp. NPDC089173 TaxID=3154965 RepID=UPI00344BA3E3
MRLRRITGLSPAAPATPPRPAEPTPTAAPATAPDPVQRSAATHRKTEQATATARPESPGHTPAPAPEAVRPALGKPLRELPSEAITSGPAGQGRPVPSAPEGQEAAAMPVLQRQISEATETASPTVTPSPAQAQRAGTPEPTRPTDAPVGPRARTRGGIGAPLTSLPSTAQVQRDAPLLGDRRRTRPGPTATPSSQTTPPQATTPPTATSTPSTSPNMPVRSAPASARPAPVQRAVDGDHPRTSAGTDTGTPASGNTAPPAPVRIRSIGPKREDGRATATTGGPALSPTVQRSRTLLSGRDLKVHTGAAEGFPAPVVTTAAGTAPRPVVAATWSRDVQRSTPGATAPGALATSSHTRTPNARTGTGQPGSTRTGDTRSGDTQSGERRTSAGARPRRNPPRTRPADPTTATATAPIAPHRTRTLGPAPMTAATTTADGGSPPGATVHRAVHAPSAPRRTTNERTTGETTDPQVTSVPKPKAATAPAQRRSAIGGALQRLVQRRSLRGPVRGPATTPSSPSPTGPSTHHGSRQPTVRPASLPSTGPSTASPQPRPSIAPPAPAPTPAQIPVVRPHPPVATPPGATVVPVQRMPLPVVPDPAGPPPAGPPPLSVRVPPRPHTPASGPTGTTDTTGQPSTQAQVLQRAAARAGISGVPVKAVPSKGSRPGSAPSAVQRAADDDRSGFAPTTETPAAETPAGNAASTTARLSGAEIEELARRLLDPVSRLIRADMRRGRERAGRLHDGRR